MKKLFAATVSVAALSAAALYGASALAADLPTKAPVYRAAAPGYNWTGWYAGVNVGVGMVQTQGSFEEAGDGTFGVGGAGFAGGAQGGFNWQFAPNWVAGFEGDIGYLGIKRSSGIDGNQLFGVKTDWYGTLRGRLGYTNGPSLFYATGGAAFVNVKNNVDIINAADSLVLASTSETAAGWTVGGGIETLLGGNWSAKAEYLYIDAGSQDVLFPDGVDSFTTFFDNRFHVYRYGVNYKFGGPVTAGVQPARNWTGLYAGVNAGAGLSQARSLLNIGAAFSDDSIAGAGFSGGVQAGYNWQFAPHWVAGIEGDIGYLGIDHSVVLFGEVDAGVKTDWYGTLRGRVGYSTGPALLYLTGGAAFVNVKNNLDNIGSTPPVFASKSETAAGWTVGGGIEAALAQNWSAKTEYLYIDAGSQDVVNPSITPDTANFDNRFHVFRFGLNYNFNAAAMAPVAARY